MRALPLLLCAALAAGCYQVKGEPLQDLTSFQVRIVGVYQPRPDPTDGTVQFGQEGVALPVVTACADRYGGDDEVPDDVRGTPDCRYALPRGSVDLDVEVIAIGKDGEPMGGFHGAVAFRATPGDLACALVPDDPDFNVRTDYRWMEVHGGRGEGVVRVSHLYGEVRIWAEDAPPEPLYKDGVAQTKGFPEGGGPHSWVTGVSGVLWFEEPTLAALQIPDDFDNRSSPFVGQFMTVGRTPESGGILYQSCLEDPERDGKDVRLVVTGTDPGGFFVTDLTACRMNERLITTGGQRQVPEPDGRQPGTFGSMYIYNYSFPEGLDRGDLLWTLSGSVQEFTGTSQLTFPSWTVRERVRQLPESEWDKHLGQVPIPELTLRHCGLDDAAEPFVTDVGCGHNRRNLKLESLESGLVKLRNVRFPQEFTNCDLDGNGTIPQFCEGPTGGGVWAWGGCSFGGACGEATPLTFDGTDTKTAIRSGNNKRVPTVGDHCAVSLPSTTTWFTFATGGVTDLSAVIAPVGAWDARLSVLAAPCEKPTEWAVTGSAGRAQIERTLDVPRLPAGTYFLRVDGYPLPDDPETMDVGSFSFTLTLRGPDGAGAPLAALTLEEKELACHVGCAANEGAWLSTVCAERATFNGFGQFVVEMAGPGPREALLDDSLPQRTERLLLPATSVVNGRSHPEGAELRVYCNTAVRYRFGDGTQVALPADPLLPANTRLDRVLGEGESRVAFLVEGEPESEPLCHIARNVSTRINLMVKDAVPELEPDCDPADADGARAEQCRFLRGATYDVVGHLRHLQPGRPRWLVLPRDKDDLCCRPGPGLQCPVPIQQCP